MLAKTLFLERILKLRAAKYYRGAKRAIYINIAIEDNITDLIIAVVILLERDINRLVVEAREVLELVKL
jgi:hypothetical protein